MVDYDKYIRDIDRHLSIESEKKEILKKLDKISVPQYKKYRINKDTIHRLKTKSEAINRLTFHNVINHLENLKNIDTKNLNQENLYLHARAALNCLKVIEKFLNKTISNENMQEYYVTKLHYMLDLATDLFLESYLKIEDNNFKYNLSIKAIEANIHFVTS